MLFTAQLPFPQNMYALNRYANYSNGNHEAWLFQLADLFLFHFFCNTSPSSVMKHCIVAFVFAPLCSRKLNAPGASNWSDTTTGWRYQQHIHSRGIKLRCGLFANAWLLCMSQTCCFRCNWNQHHANETPYPSRLCLSKSSHSLLTLYIGFCCAWLCTCMMRYVFTWTHKHVRNDAHLWPFCTFIR